MQLWLVSHFFPVSTFAVALLLHPPTSYEKNGQEMFKKCSTDQRFIWKRNTTYKIGTLVELVLVALQAGTPVIEITQHLPYVECNLPFETETA